MNEDAKKALRWGTKSVLTISLMATVAAKYGAKITDSYMSGAVNLANEFSGTKSKNVVMENASKIAEKTFGATTKFLSNLRNRVNR